MPADSPTLIDCPVCGFRFDPDAHPGCRSCPLHANCATACCPRCGHTTINPRRSRLSRWVASILKSGDQPRHEAQSSVSPDSRR